jgi:type II restriction/modification system DNA methylase subunit YeeA
VFYIYNDKWCRIELKKDNFLKIVEIPWINWISRLLLCNESGQIFQGIPICRSVDICAIVINPHV